jgi:DNA repair photolyase
VRWKVDGDGEQGSLFDLPEREIGRGEFRGLTFFHVRAKRLINTMPASSVMPFRHTLNAYRGCSHSCSYCFARPTHAYLDLDIGEGFDHDIVVKVNAVERVRAETDPKRWAGEPIAMGTNTDPYQRCEGKYRLTRGIIEVLTAARNPFSILTKSTLVVSDIERLAEASRHTDVTVNFSIGTLDEAVWKATEPGTPHPRQRVAAIAKLRDAGIRTGALIAPVLPGLSDGVDQLRAVVAACKEAGASTIAGGMVLRLGPGVREVFLARLAATHPDLVAWYESTYRGANAPRRTRDRVARIVEDAVGQSVPTTRLAPPVRRVDVAPPPAAEQPSLDL